jgi:glycosyltransferase involved in cell wall biosynthesis
MPIDLEDITVIMPTRDEAANIGPSLWSLDPSIWLVVVDASTDETPALVAKQRPERTTVICQPSTVTEARQLGAAEARTAWLLFTDADVSFAATYFRRLHVHPADADLIYGAKHSVGDYQRYYRWFSWGQRLAHGLGVPAASGSNLLVRREVFWACGGFDLQLTVNEDSELAWRIKRTGHRVEFDPELVVYERDHRRLRRGALRKTLHSLARCALLYLNLIPSRWRGHDWGYWAGRSAARESR